MKFSQRSCLIMKRRSKTFLKNTFTLMRRFATVWLEVVRLATPPTHTLSHFGYQFRPANFPYLVKVISMLGIIMTAGFVFAWRKVEWLSYLLEFIKWYITKNMQESLLFVEEWEKLLCFTIPFLRELGFSRKTATLAQRSKANAHVVS